MATGRQEDLDGPIFCILPVKMATRRQEDFDAMWALVNMATRRQEDFDLASAVSAKHECKWQRDAQKISTRCANAA